MNEQLTARATVLEGVINFLYGEVTEQDQTTIRAMIVEGGTDEQIKRALTISAINQRVEREDKSRYAFGCLRNIMMETDEEDAA